MTSAKLPRYLVLLPLTFTLPAAAQDDGDAADVGQPAVQVGGGTYGGGSVAPGTNINAHLPSSSRPVMGEGSTDGFDLNQEASGTGSVIVGSGGESGPLHLGTFSGYGRKQAPQAEFHVVRPGDTLWDLSAHYYSNPWSWPQLWSLNPQVENPHWIYPGDQLRLRRPSDRAGAGEAEPAASGLAAPLIARRTGIAQDTIFLRDQGYIGDPDKDVWGEVVGSAEDQMLLSYGNHVYMLMREGVDARIGQQLTVFLEVRQPDNVPGARRPPGQIVKVYGTVRVDQWDPETRVARGEIIESVDVIERGAKVGPVGRRFDVVPPKPATADVMARVIASVYPHVHIGQHQVVFLDKGSEDGLEPGNRLKVLRRGDAWRQGLKTAPRMARARIRLDSPELVPSEITPLKGDDTQFPDEIIGEVRVLRTEKYSSVALVTESSQELRPGDRLVAAAGY